MELEDARSLSQTTDDNTCVSNAEVLMHLKSAYSNGFLLIVTPFIWKKWHELLDLAGVLQEFVDVPKGIRFGWCLSVPDSFPPNCIYIPNNHKSALERLEFIISYIHSEVAAGCYSGPFSPDHLERIIDYFRTSPLSVWHIQVSPLLSSQSCIHPFHQFSYRLLTVSL
jgi:hypothetical protein